MKKASQRWSILKLKTKISRRIPIKKDETKGKAKVSKETEKAGNKRRIQS